MKVNRSSLITVCGFISASPASSILADATFALLTAGMSAGAKSRSEKSESPNSSLDLAASKSPRTFLFLSIYAEKKKPAAGWHVHLEVLESCTPSESRVDPFSNNER